MYYVLESDNAETYKKKSIGLKRVGKNKLKALDL